MSDGNTEEVWEEMDTRSRSQDSGGEYSDGNEAEDENLQNLAPEAQFEAAVRNHGLERFLELNPDTFEQTEFPTAIVKAVQEMWQTWTSGPEGREARGEAFYTQLFDAAPSLQIVFKSPKAVMAMRFMTGLGSLISVMGKPSALFTTVEGMGFRHLDIDVTGVRAGFFREALMDTIDEGLGENFTLLARVGIHALLNYAGSAFCFVRREYAGRISTILKSWSIVQKANIEEVEVNAEGEESGEIENAEVEHVENVKVEESMQDTKTSGATMNRESGEKENREMKVPTTFNEMLLFNASVMGFGSSSWMNIVLVQWDDIVKNVANFSRLQEECDVMSLVLAKYKGKIELPEFKAVTLASLRSLLPQEWDSDHEVAWGWLWENVEGLLKNMLGKPKLQEHALERFFGNLPPEEAVMLQRQLFPAFFELAPAGQDFLKQSATRINFIADKVLAMSLEMYRSPRRMVEEISAVGLRHVGYAVPTEMFPPFVSASVALMQRFTTEELVVQAFRWSLALIAKILVRTISEGSTLVMKAINTNQKSTLKKAMDVCPRGQRASELLSISVGTQSISPFYWSIDSGALVCAQTILEDLLTIRADRDVYYYGCDHLFTRHPEVIQRLCLSAPTLLPTLLDGLIWRSRQTKEGMRRVNYYVKHLIQDLEGNVSPNLECLVTHGDPQTIRFPAVVLFSDILWSRVASYKFLASKIYFLVILAVFITGQCALFRHTGPQTLEEDVVMLTCRSINYLGSLPKLFISQIKHFFADIRNGDIGRVCGLPIPTYLLNFQESASLMLLCILVIMALQEPFFWCLSENYGVTQSCKAAEERKDFYSVCAFLAMMLYWGLLTDLAIFSMKISSYVLVCGRVAGEVGLFLIALIFLLLAFSTAISALYYEMPEKAGAAVWLEELTSMSLRMYPQDSYQWLVSSSVIITVPVCIFLFIVFIFMANLLVAQLAQSYHDAYSNMQGYARLNRASITATTVQAVPRKKWSAFLSSLRLDEQLEFNEGDVGLSGGIQVQEHANAHPVTEDIIKRFGGSTAPSAPWPREIAMEEEEEDKLGKLEKRLAKMVKSQTKRRREGSTSEGSSGPSMGSSKTSE
ncbi:unnamed protein product [Effrenium voratum]|uniref:Globin domain-containing protein n=1 Tax=Effrenium voratum TaxID=2562239 RepID=A0AA36JFB4_9DINO|nr:unnamed protein product [Effrenium voratum]